MAERVKRAVHRFAWRWQDHVRGMNASLRSHKTKIVATIGPASDSPEMLTRLIRPESVWPGSIFARQPFQSRAR